MQRGIGKKYGKITFKWFKKRVTKTYRTTKALKRLLSKRRRKEKIDCCKAKSDLKYYIKGVIDP